MAKYALIGEKLSHSYSKEIHSFFGLDYTLEEVKRERLESFLHISEYSGFNVTIPYKTEVMPFLDEISEEAIAVGAVNTIVKKGDRLLGYNTDIEGMRTAINRDTDTLKSKTVAILGSGGASKAAVYLAKTEGAKRIILVSRTGEVNYTNIYNKEYTDSIEAIINTTPVGMYPNVDVSPIDLSCFSKLAFVFDAVYNPLNTVFRLDAKGIGLSAPSGLYMLVSQAVKAEEIWGVNDYTKENVDSAFRDIYLKKCNIVLEGMPGSGKTTIGRILAEKLNKTFVDTDEEFKKRTGITPAAFIKAKGEAEFRSIESEVVQDFSKMPSLVIALGGGAVLKKGNRSTLKQNGIIVYIKRPLEFLATKNRPITATKGAEQLFRERASIYEDFKTFSATNSTTLDTVIAEIQKNLLFFIDK